MPGFFELPPEVRFMIYRLLLPKQILESLRDLSSAFISFNDMSPGVTGDLRPFYNLNMNLPEWGWTSSNIFLANRQIFTEIYPLLYSQHSFHMKASLAALRFFRQIGQLNRDALRDIHIHYKSKMINLWLSPKDSYEVLRWKRKGTDHRVFSSWQCASPRRGANFFNVLAKCSNAAITINTTFRTLGLLDGSTEHPAFVNMHGFKTATTRLTSIARSDDWPRPRVFHTRCHRQDASERAILQRLHNGANRMKSQCPKGCSVHKECTSMNTSATVHLEVECDICWECAHNDFLSVWVEKKGCIFGL